MLSAVLNMGPEATAGLFHLSTPDSILMSYQKLAATCSASTHPALGRWVRRGVLRGSNSMP